MGFNGIIVSIKRFQEAKGYDKCLWLLHRGYRTRLVLGFGIIWDKMGF
jgi:hypothetical protein